VRVNGPHLILVISRRAPDNCAARFTAGCSALMWLNQRRVGVTIKYFDACTRAIFAG
jgi:hypothetical protein